jgi:hypothetical protein
MRIRAGSARYRLRNVSTHASHTRRAVSSLAILAPLISVLAVITPASAATADPAVAPPTNPTTVVAWGDNRHGESTVPAGLTDVTAVAAGGNYSLALKADGTVAAWGDDSAGQSTVPAGLTGVTKVAAGSDLSLALKNDGTVAAWGGSECGQKDVPAGLDHVVAISTQPCYSLALKDDGTVVDWGWGQWDGPQRYAPPDLDHVTAIAAGQCANLALKDDGTVVSWGDGSPVEGFYGVTDVTAIASGSECLALRRDGTVVSQESYSGSGSGSMGSHPWLIPAGLGHVTDVAAGGFDDVAVIDDGTATSWGDGPSRMGVPEGLDHIRQISIAAKHGLALTAGRTGPMTTISCNNEPCFAQSGPLVPAEVRLDAFPTAGSPVRSTVYTTDGSDPATSPTAAVYTGSFSVPAVSTVRFASTDEAGNVEPSRSQRVGEAYQFVLGPPPTTTIACNGSACSSDVYGGTVSVTLTPHWVDQNWQPPWATTRYTLDGSDPRTSSTTQEYYGPFSIAASTTIRYYSDEGHPYSIEPAQTQLLQVELPHVDTSPPTTSILCNGTTCSSTGYSAPVSVSLTAVDEPGGSGVARTSYSVNGVDPATSTSARRYDGPFTVSQTTTVEVSSRDVLGNVEPTKFQVVTVDPTPPTTAISCNGGTCNSTPYAGSVSVSVNATDEPGGSGVARTVYTVDGSDPTTSTSAQTYSGPFTVSRTTTVKASSTDHAGNVEPAKTQVISIVTQPPTKGSVTLSPTDDSYTAKGNPGATHGSEGSVNVNSGTERRSFVKFTVAGIPQGATGVNATLKLFSQSGAPTTVSFPVSQVSSAWTESSLTWLNQPALGPTLSTKSGLTNGAINAFDLANLVTGNGTYAVAITSNNTTQRYFSSKEASAAQRPQIVVSWTNPTG